MERLESQAIPVEAPPLKSDSPSEIAPFIIRPSLLSRFQDITCALSTRKGGVSPEPYCMNTSLRVGDASDNVQENRRRFLNVLSLTPDRLAFAQQEHTANVRRISTPGTYERCDALMSDVPGVFLSVSVADCTPVFLFDASCRAVACIHAGWRGTEQGIVEKTVNSMQREFGSKPEEIHAFLGPAAGQCCYEVGADVAQKFDAGLVVDRHGKRYLDIKRANWQQLRTCGVPENNIEVHADCTICKSHLYHSYRRDRERSGRMMGIIGINV